MRNGRLWAHLAALLIHSVFASLTIVIGVAAGLALLVFTTHGAPRAVVPRELMEVVCLTIFWGTPLLSGFFINRSARNRAACRVWAVGLLFLLAVVIWDISIFKRSPYYQKLTGGQFLSYESHQLFGLDAGKWGKGDGLEEIFVVVPVLGSIAYSLGAWFALREGPPSESATGLTSPQG
jgi:hypothetical protein